MSVATRERVALVDSPFQLLSLFEAIHAGVVEAPQRLVTRRMPADALLQLGAELIDEAHVVADPAQGQLFRLARQCDRLTVGDPYSSLIHAVLATSPRLHLVLVDDGAATLRAIDTLAGAPQPLTRAHAVRTRQRLLSRFGAAAIARRARRGSVTLCTGLPLGDDRATALVARGYEVAQHSFGWSRNVPLPHPVYGGTIRRVVLGSSLAHDGLLAPGFYADWLRAALDRPGTLFVGHRRDLLSHDLAIECGATTYPSGDGLPVELLVRDLPDGLEIHTLPSTAALTIPPIRGARATVICCTLPSDGDVTDRCTPAMRELQRRIHDLTVAVGSSDG